MAGALIIRRKLLRGLLPLGERRIYLEKCFQDAGLAPGGRCRSWELDPFNLMFLVHPTITSEQMVGYADSAFSGANLYR